MRFFNSRNYTILSEMVRTDFKVRYQGSLLGYVWSLLKPLAIFSIMYIVFTVIWPVAKGVPYYAVYLLLGIMLWNFFSETTILGASSIVAHGSLIRKINIPRYLIVIAASISALINLALSLMVVFAFAIISKVPLDWHMLALVPVLLELFAFSLGVAFLLSTLYVKFRDVAYIWEIMLQAGLYASAIIFPLINVNAELRKYFFLNPMVQIIQDARYALIHSSEVVTLWNVGAGWKITIAPFLIIGLLSMAGVYYFKSRSKYFAENV